MRHRPRRAGALELHEDRGGLRMADPDRQELVAIDGLQEHDRLLANHVEADAVDDHLLHENPPRGGRPEYRYRISAAHAAAERALSAAGSASAQAAAAKAPELVAEEVQRRRRGDRERLGGDLGQAGGLDEHGQQQQADRLGTRLTSEEAHRLVMGDALARVEGPVAVPEEVVRHRDDPGGDRGDAVVDAERRGRTACRRRG